VPVRRRRKPLQPEAGRLFAPLVDQHRPISGTDASGNAGSWGGLSVRATRRHHVYPQFHLFEPTGTSICERRARCERRSRLYS
jgi:hypothetical protein